MTDGTAASRKGYTYQLSDDAIRKYMEWPLEVRLTWLEEANRFLFDVLSDETKKLRRSFRKGDI